MQRARSALVDSGADGSVLPLTLARELKVRFDPHRSRIAVGSGGPYAEFQAESDVIVATEVGRVTLTRPSINPHVPFALLGRRDFFAVLRVCCDERRLRTEVTPAR